MIVRGERASADDVPADDGWLATIERTVLARLRVPARRRDWRLGRWTAKRVVADRLGDDVALPAIEIRTAADGAPEVVVGETPLPWPLSLSHRDGAALAVLGDEPARLGCDVELIEPRSPAFVADFFTARECAAVARASAPDVWAAVVWSAKESALKARREGLRTDTRTVEVEADVATAAVGAWQPLEVRATDTGETFRGWWRRDGRLVLSVVGDVGTAAPPELRP